MGARTSWKYLAIVTAFGFVTPNRSSAASALSAPLRAGQVIERMVALNRARAAALRSYSSTRIYHVENDNHSKSAELVVRVVFHWPNQKESTIISESGSNFLQTRVLMRLLESEREAMRAENQRHEEMCPENYDFRMLKYEQSSESNDYVLEVVPKSKDKFLFQGRIWVDGRDFGIIRMEGTPARNPSWWTTHVDVVHSYRRLGEFWLPERNVTVAQVRMFGRSVLTIEYKDYKLIETRSVQVPGSKSALAAVNQSSGHALWPAFASAPPAEARASAHPAIVACSRRAREAILVDQSEAFAGRCF